MFQTIWVVTAALGITGGTVPTDPRLDAVGAVIRRDGLTDNCAEEGDAPDMRGSCVLIAPDVILSIRRVPSSDCHSTVEHHARFRRRPDCGLGSYNCPDAPGEGPGSFYDVRVACWATPRGNEFGADCDPPILGFLEHPVPHIRPIPVRLDDKMGYPIDVIAAGWGISDSPSGFFYAGLRVAQTQISHVDEFCVPDDRLHYTTSVGLQVADSGGPAIYADPLTGELSVVGVHKNVGRGRSMLPFATRTFVVRATDRPNCPDVWNLSCPSCVIASMQFPTPVWVQCDGDADRDNDVDFDDLNLVLGNLGTSCVGDDDYSGAVDFDDLNRVLGNFGQICEAPGSMRVAQIDCTRTAELRADDTEDTKHAFGAPLKAPLGPEVPGYVELLGWPDAQTYHESLLKMSPEERATHAEDLAAAWEALKED